MKFNNKLRLKVIFISLFLCYSHNDVVISCSLYSDILMRSDLEKNSDMFLYTLEEKPFYVLKTDLRENCEGKFVLSATDPTPPLTTSPFKSLFLPQLPLRCPVSWA